MGLAVTLRVGATRSRSWLASAVAAALPIGTCAGLILGYPLIGQPAAGRRANAADSTHPFETPRLDPNRLMGSVWVGDGPRRGAERQRTVSCRERGQPWTRRKAILFVVPVAAHGSNTRRPPLAVGLSLESGPCAASAIKVAVASTAAFFAHTVPRLHPLRPGRDRSGTGRSS